MPKRRKEGVYMHAGSVKLDLLPNTVADCVAEGEPALVKGKLIDSVTLSTMKKYKEM